VPSATATPAQTARQSSPTHIIHTPQSGSRSQTPLASARKIPTLNPAALKPTAAAPTAPVKAAPATKPSTMTTQQAAPTTATTPTKAAAATPKTLPGTAVPVQANAEVIQRGSRFTQPQRMVAPVGLTLTSPRAVTPRVAPRVSAPIGKTVTTAPADVRRQATPTQDTLRNGLRTQFAPATPTKAPEPLRQATPLMYTYSSPAAGTGK